MKKLILPLLLLVAFGMLAAVESDPSNVVGYVKYPCVSGYTAVALPMEEGYTLTSEVGNNYAGSVDAISVWNQTVQQWDLCQGYDLGGEYLWDPDFSIATGTPLLFTNILAYDFYSIGDLPATNAQYTTVAGYNYIMLPLNKSSLNLTSLVGADIGNSISDNLSVWNNTNQSWDLSQNYDLGGDYLWDPDFPVTIGQPMLYVAISPTTWPPSPRGVNFGTRSK